MVAYSPLKSENGGMSVRNKYKYMALVLGIVTCGTIYMVFSYANDNKMWIKKHDFLLQRLQQATKKNRLFTQDLLSCKAKSKEYHLANMENVKVISGFKDDLRELKNEVTANDNKFMKCYRFYQDVKDILGLTEEVGSRFKDPIDGNVNLAVFTEVEDTIRTIKANLSLESKEKLEVTEKRDEAVALNAKLQEDAETMKEHCKNTQAQLQEQLNECNNKMTVVSSNAENSNARIATLEENLHASQKKIDVLELHNKIKTQAIETTKKMMNGLMHAKDQESQKVKALPDQVVAENKPIQSSTSSENPAQQENPTVAVTQEGTTQTNAEQIVDSIDKDVVKDDESVPKVKEAAKTSENVPLVKEAESEYTKEKSVQKESVETETNKNVVNPPNIEGTNLVDNGVKEDSFESPLKGAMEKRKLDLKAKLGSIEESSMKEAAEKKTEDDVAAVPEKIKEEIDPKENEKDKEDSKDSKSEDINSNLTEEKSKDTPEETPVLRPAAPPKGNTKVEDEEEEEEEEEEGEDEEVGVNLLKKPALPALPERSSNTLRNSFDE